MSAGKRKNSRQKGARGEREAAKYLTSLGFKAERNGRNGITSDDLIVSGTDMHIEVKRVESMGVGTKALSDALRQSGENMRDGNVECCVLWRKNGGKWHLTMKMFGVEWTTAGDESIANTLKFWSKNYDW